MAADPSMGPNMAQITSINNAAAGMAGQDSTAQLRLCSVLPNLDYKPLFRMEEMAGMQFLNKSMMRTEQLKMFLTAQQNGSCLGPIGILLSMVWDELSKGKDIQDWAGDLSPEELRQLQSIAEVFGENQIEGMDASHMKSLVGMMSLQNVAMNQAAMMQNDGPGLG